MSTKKALSKRGAGMWSSCALSFMLIVPLFMFLSCINPGSDGNSTKVSGVTVSPATKSTTVGSNFTLAATVSPSNAQNKGVSWSSSAPGVASVSSNGTVNAVSAGTAAITVTTDDGGFTATCTVTVTVSTKRVTGVSVDTASKTMHPADTFKLNATIAPVDADNQNVSWSTSNPSVVTVDSSGNMTAKAKGTALITATTEEGGFHDECAVTVEVPVTGVTLNPTAKTLGPAQTFQLTATVSPADASNTAVTWTSSNPAVATVSNTGLVTALIAGTTNITVTTTDGAKTAVCAITVQLISVTGISLDQVVKSTTTGSQFTLHATLQPADPTDPTITWSSSAPAVATVDSAGKVTAAGPGIATITATSTDGGFTAACVLTVTDPVNSVTGVTLNSTSQNMLKGSTFTLNATIAPVNASNKTVTWTSSNPLVASVNAVGLVTAVSSGNATITVTTEDGAKTATCAVTVTSPVTGVSLNSAAQTLLPPATFQLNATVSPSDASDASVTWSSSAPAIATVSNTGLVTAVAPGAAVITVTTTDGNKTAVCAVTVATPLTGISLNKSALTLDVNTASALTVSPVPSNAVLPTITWTSSNNATASVSSSGLVTAHAAGTATITASAGGGIPVATCVVTVVIPALSVSISPDAVVLVLGQSSQQFTATVLPANATDKTVTWTSSNPALVSVDSTGKATVNSILSLAVTITATTANGKTATATITRVL